MTGAAQEQVVRCGQGLPQGLPSPGMNNVIFCGLHVQHGHLAGEGGRQVLELPQLGQVLPQPLDAVGRHCRRRQPLR